MPHLQDPVRSSLALLGLAAGLLLVGPQRLRAQEADSASVSAPLYDGPTEYVPKRWTAEDGLPNNSVWALEQADSGALWVGTLGGLARFDGHAFTTFDAGTDGLAGNRITALHQAADGRLWVGTATGTSVYRNGRFRQIDSPVGAEAIDEGTRGTIWLGGVAGLYRARAGTVTEIALPDSIDRKVFDVAAVGADSAWVVVGGHLLLYRNGDFKRPYRLGGKERWVQRVERAPDGRLWVKLESQVASIDEGMITRWDVGSSREESFRIGRSGVAWLTTPDGLLRLTPSAHRPVRIDGDLPERLMTLTPDGSGQWWIGTYNRGLIRLRPRLFRHFDEGPALGTAVHGVTVDDRGALWAGILETGVLRVTGSGSSLWTEADGLPHDNVWTVGHDATGTPWIATNQGLVRRRGTRFEPILGTNGSPFRWTYALYRDSTGALWIPDHDRGLYRYQEDTLSRVLPPDSLSEGMQALHRDRDGAIWIGTRSEGVARFKDGSLTWYGPDDGLPYKNVRGVHETTGGALWVSTYGGGIARFEGDHFTPVTPEDGLPAGTIHTIHEAPDGIFWMTSNEGVFRIPRSQVEAVADGRRDRLYVQTFGTEDGMPSRECNGNFQPALAEDGAGRLWIPTMGGLTVVDPSSPMLAVPDSLPVRVTAARADGTPHSLDSLRLTPSTYRVALDFTALSLRHADDLSFRYRLDGESWTPARGRRTAEFTSLDAGTHRFEVQATINGETWYRLKQPFRFAVAPHFYQTWWFRFLVVLAMIGLAGGAYRWRTVRLRKRQEELAAAVEERTQELEAEKEKTKRQAERLAELDEAKNRFFAHVSHEFRTPLSLILSPLRDGLRTGQRLGLNQMERMVNNAERLRRLIDQLLDLATLEAGRMTLDRRPGDLASVVERSAEAFRSKAEQKEIALRIERPEERIETRFDPEKVETIVSNLVGNAVKFTPDGGRVTVRVETADSTAPVEAPGADASAQGTAVIAVDDTGPGIEADVQNTIFDRFEQSRPSSGSTTRKHEGTGLGLALTSELVELHGGTIDVESTPGEGATFTVQLPLVSVADVSVGEGENGGVGDGREARGEGRTEAVRASDKASSADAQRDGDAATVLVVEDNAEMRAYLREQFAGTWAVIEAADGEEGWQTVKEERPALVISDVMMPELDGFELCRRIKADEALRTIPVLLLTARAGEAATREGLKCGADDYVAKPFDAEELRQRIDNHLAARRHLQARYRTEVEIGAAVVDEEDRSFVEDLTAVIDEQLGNPDLTVADLADAMALSRRQFSRRVKQATGESPGDLLRRHRLERAKQMLEREPDTIAEVAYAVGFQSHSAFSRSFRERVGCSPSDYAEQAA